MNVARYTIDSEEWGRVLLLRPIPKDGDIWGDLSVLRGTPWGDQIYAISGEVLSHALHGHVMPLMRALGTPPLVRARRLPPEYQECALIKSCILSGPECKPGSTVPACYTPPVLPPEAQQAASVVALAWKEGRHVVVVEGPEFVV